MKHLFKVCERAETGGTPPPFNSQSIAAPPESAKGICCCAPLLPRLASSHPNTRKLYLNAETITRKVYIPTPNGCDTAMPSSSTTLPVKLTLPAVDGFPLHAQLWRQAADTPPAPLVIINPATSVDSRYYSRFADFLCGHGFNVLTYDYRGIGGSRPEKMRGFDASWLDWGGKDFEGVLRFAATHYPAHPLCVIGHSVGGLLVGMAPSNHLIERVFTMGAQFAYWRDYAKNERLAMYLRWHIVMPTLTALFGYFPGKRLGWLEDTPRGVVRDWVAAHPRLEDICAMGSPTRSAEARAELVASFGQLTGATLALSVTDDAFGTIPAIQRLLHYYKNSPSTHVRIEPRALGQDRIGHFAFFHARYADSLWHIPLVWLRDGKVSDHVPHERITAASPL